MNTEKFVPEESEEEELLKRKKERQALLKALQKRKEEMAAEKNDKKKEEGSEISGELKDDAENAEMSSQKDETEDTSLVST